MKQEKVVKLKQNKAIAQIYDNLQRNIIGQEELVKNLIIALLAGGHVLLEGMPGLAKTKSAETLANSIQGDFKRIQFTPDLLPSDLVGTDIYLQGKSKFEFAEGPLFANIILADEINRAPAKVQSALLEAMAEKHITVGKQTYDLPELFLVIATQNPIEQEGTYNLPEAQLDRFLLHVKIDYPESADELKILEQFETPAKKSATTKVQPKDILKMQKEVSEVYLDPKLKKYIVDLIMATREPEKFDKELKGYINYGASPRATLALCQTAKALAYLEGEEYVTPYHIQNMAVNVLRHRIILSYKAEAENVIPEQIIKHLIDLVAV